MAKLDRLIQVMHEQRADSLQLAVGKPASLVAGGGTRALTRDPLNDGQILALLREIAAGETTGQLGAGAVAFAYRAPSGEVQVEVASGPDGTSATVRSARAAAAPAARSAQELADAREAIHELFRLLVSSGASDLHLRSGEPPMLRRHGEVVREAKPPIPGELLETMLVSIMSPRDVGEYRETGDTDWAYEIEGLARFRCNAGRDRHEIGRASCRERV